MVDFKKALPRIPERSYQIRIPVEVYDVSIGESSKHVIAFDVRATSPNRAVAEFGIALTDLLSGEG